MSRYKAATVRTTTEMQVSVDTRGFEITFDEPESTNVGMNPVEIPPASFGVCQVITVQALAKECNFGLRISRVTIEGDLGRENVTDGKNVHKFTGIRYQPHFRSSESDEDIKKLLTDVAAKCPMENTLTYGTEFVQDGFVKVD